MKSSRENWEASVMGKAAVEESVLGHNSHGGDVDAVNCDPNIPSS